jgi:site-specific recombinase XerD
MLETREEVNKMPEISAEPKLKLKPPHTRRGLGSELRPKRLPTVLTEEERTALLGAPNPNQRIGLRNLCLLRLMLNGGLRSAEVLKLKVRDLDWQTGKVMVVKGKGNKDRALWIGAEDLELLEKWRHHRAQLPESEFLFTTLDGKRLKDRYLRCMVKRLALQAGIDKDVHPHMLRHTFATDLFRQTKNLRLTQKALGHAQLTSTQIYTHIVDDELEAALKTFRGGGKKK